MSRLLQTLQLSRIRFFHYPMYMVQLVILALSPAQLRRPLPQLQMLLQSIVQRHHILRILVRKELSYSLKLIPPIHKQLLQKLLDLLQCPRLGLPLVVLACSWLCDHSDALLYPDRLACIRIH